MARKSLEYLYTWSVLPSFMLLPPDYYHHLTSQMYFYNLQPMDRNKPVTLPPSFKTLQGNSAHNQTASNNNTTSSPDTPADRSTNTKVKWTKELRSLYRVDAALRLEWRDEALHSLREHFPGFKHSIPETTVVSNIHEGVGNTKFGQVSHDKSYSRSKNVKARKMEGEAEEYSCDLAWALYRYFIQDFECFKYKLPPQCYKEACREKPKKEEEEEVVEGEEIKEDVVEKEEER